MVTVKRVNMDIDAELWKSVKKAAIDQDIELREWVAQALKEKLDVDSAEGLARKGKKVI